LKGRKWKKNEESLKKKEEGWREVMNKRKEEKMLYECVVVYVCMSV
jgi:hypothetical protein